MPHRVSGRAAGDDGFSGPTCPSGAFFNPALRLAGAISNMAVKATSRPAARKTATAKAAPAKKATPAEAKVAKPKAAKTKVAKTKVGKTKAAKTQAAKAKAAVAARKATVDAVVRREDVATLKIDPADEAAGSIVARAKPATRPTRARRSAVDRLNDPPPATGAVLIERVSRAIERELTQIEALIGDHRVNRTQRTEGERRARTLASLARTLREVMALRASDRKEKSEDDDAVPRDIDALRLALARRLDSLVADAKAAHPESPE